MTIENSKNIYSYPSVNSKTRQNKSDFLSLAQRINESLDKAEQNALISGHDERNEYKKYPELKAQTNFEKALNAVKNITNANTGEKFEFESLSLEDQGAMLK